MSQIPELEGLRAEVGCRPNETRNRRNVLRARGYLAHRDEALPNPVMRALGIRSLFMGQSLHCYQNDLIAGSVRGLLVGEPVTEEDFSEADRTVSAYPERGFLQNADHFAPDYETFLSDGIGGTLARIDKSLQKYQDDREKTETLTAMRIAMTAFSDYIARWATAFTISAERETDPTVGERHKSVAATLREIVHDAPKTFRSALQLVWLVHTAFYYEGRYAMAFGRMDQFLYPFYRHDTEKGILTHDEAVKLVACTLYKIREAWYFGGDNVCNIAIGGVIPEDGSDATNDLSFVILEAVGLCNIPGPNLSARLHENTTDEFRDACLRVIGQGIGYPALMNDGVNIPALLRMGYPLEICRNYCMVGCIENFLQGAQPPWSDGRFNTPVYLEYALNNGRSFTDGNLHGIETGDADSFHTMEELLDAFRRQMEHGAKEYISNFYKTNTVFDSYETQSPFLSCFCRDCIGRGLDINCGGALYPSVHGACLMGIATVADSLAVIDRYVFCEHKLTLGALRDILKADYVGYEAWEREFLTAPKYGNGEPLPDGYAQWFVDTQAEIFDRYRTPDGGRIYVAIASNISNIPAGYEVGATPDGRHAKTPLSDAASPMHGRDKNGTTAVVLSCSKPDYKKVACGTVLNQKYSGEMFRNPEKRAKLGAMIKTYFSLGGQEIQINSVTRSTLLDAQAHPENYENLVVRVSGFSAYYTLLSRAVQDDILARTEHE